MWRIETGHEAQPYDDSAHYLGMVNGGYLSSRYVSDSIEYHRKQIAQGRAASLSLTARSNHIHSIAEFVSHGIGL